MADALASGASVRKDVGVQVPPRAQDVFGRTVFDHAEFRNESPHFEYS